MILVFCCLYFFIKDRSDLTTSYCWTESLDAVNLFFFFPSCTFFLCLFHTGTMSICFHLFSVFQPLCEKEGVDSLRNSRATTLQTTLLDKHAPLEAKLKQMFPSAFRMCASVDLRCFYQISLFFGGWETDIFGSKSHSWKAATVAHYIYLFCAFSPYKSISTDVPRTEERQSSLSQKDLERRQAWIHVACQILSIVGSWIRFLCLI